MEQKNATITTDVSRLNRPLATLHARNMISLFCMVLAASFTALASVPIEWVATPRNPAPATFERRHGETLDFRCTLAGFGELPFADTSDIRLWYQTNGMAQSWWSVPASFSSNVIFATFQPKDDPGTDRISLFFGAPSNAYISANLRLLPSPGFIPNLLPPPDVLTWHTALDEIRSEIVSATNNVLAEALSADMTTNDVCAIVTNEVVSNMWSVSGMPNGYYVSDIYYYSDVWHVEINHEGYGIEVPGTGNETKIEFVFLDSNVVAQKPTRNALGFARLIDLPPLTNNLASKADATLAETNVFSKWTIYRDGVDVTDQVMSQPTYDSTWSVILSVLPGEITSGATEQPGPDALELTWTGDDAETLEPVATYTANRTRLPFYVLGTQTNRPLASAESVLFNSVQTAELRSTIETNYYTKAQTDDAIDALAAYYITADAEGSAFANYVALTNATVYYSGGVTRTPTRNDYAVVLADETHDGNEWRYIFSVPSGATNGQWEAQYPIETNDYEALSNKPQINGVELSGNKSASALGLATPSAVSVAALAGTNFTVTSISSADTTYKSFALTSPTNVNQSVQFLNIASLTPSTIDIPLPAGGGTKDWIIYIYAATNVTLRLPAATWWMPDAANTNDIAPATPTALYFSEIGSGKYLFSRQELTEVVTP